MKTTLQELRKNNGGYAFGREEITEADLRLVNSIIECIEETRLEIPQRFDRVEYTDEFGDYYPDAIIDGDTYHDGKTALCERGSAYIRVGEDGLPHGSISGGSFPHIDAEKLEYIGKREELFWTFSTLGAGAHQGLYFKAEVSYFRLNVRAVELRKYTQEYYDCIYVQDRGEKAFEIGYRFTVQKDGYAFCAFKEEKALNEFLSLYEAVEEPCYGNAYGSRKYWILKSHTVYVWTDDEYAKIKCFREERCLFNGRKVPTKFAKEGNMLVKYVLRSDESRYE